MFLKKDDDTSSLPIEIFKPRYDNHAILNNVSHTYDIPGHRSLTRIHLKDIDIIAHINYKHMIDHNQMAF